MMVPRKIVMGPHHDRRRFETLKPRGDDVRCRRWPETGDRELTIVFSDGLFGSALAGDAHSDPWERGPRSISDASSDLRRAIELSRRYRREDGKHRQNQPRRVTVTETALTRSCLEDANSSRSGWFRTQNCEPNLNTNREER